MEKKLHQSWSNSLVGKPNPRCAIIRQDCDGNALTTSNLTLALLGNDMFDWALKASCQVDAKVACSWFLDPTWSKKKYGVDRIAVKLA